ncbi:MAG: ABC transporter ATP-binding protein/permease [Proteobacteria bacterium]|nr:ABC transporter ATP-binding protein/permease [Pseudomonadota bacterium]MBU1593921.1 ABC transporter ATP-binding protein/permease [Pseudomonadota bacterium]
MRFATPSWFYFIRQFPRHTISMLFFLTLAGVVESVGAVSVLPLLGGLFGKDPTNNALLVKINQFFLSAGVVPSLGNILLTICAAMILKAVLTLMAYQQTGYVEAEITTRLRSEMLDCLLRAKWSYFVSQPAGRLTFALSSESSQAGVALRCICQVLSQLFQALSYLVAGLYISWEVMVAALVVGGVFFTLFRGLISYVRRAGVRQAEALNSMTSFFTDALIGAKPLKVMAAEEKFLLCIRALAERFKVAARQHVLGVGLLTTIQEPLLTILLAGGIYASKQTLNMDEAMLFTMAFFFHRLVSRFSAAQQNYQQYALQEAQFVSLLSKIKEVSEHEQPADSGSPIILRHAVDLEQVDFSYGERPVLRGLTLSIPFGAITALSGPSGSGKTTVTDLVTGLVRPTGGKVLIDNVPLEDVDIRTWREQIGYVPQEVFLFNDTVRSNVAIGREFSDAEIWAALDKAGARSFVEATPQGLDAMVGEHGRGLSGGQRQRLMIARAVIAGPRLLILDEATTGLDPATADEIMATVARLKQNMAVLVVSHQGSVRKVADRVYETVAPQAATEAAEA